LIPFSHDMGFLNTLWPNGIRFLLLGNATCIELLVRPSDKFVTK